MPHPMQILFPDGAVWFGAFGFFQFTFDPSQVPNIIEHPTLDHSLIDPETLGVNVAWFDGTVWHGGFGTADRTIARAWLKYYTPLPPPLFKPPWWVDDTDAVVRRLNKGPW